MVYGTGYTIVYFSTGRTNEGLKFDEVMQKIANKFKKPLNVYRVPIYWGDVDDNGENKILNKLKLKNKYSAILYFDGEKISTKNGVQDYFTMETWFMSNLINYVKDKNNIK